MDRRRLTGIALALASACGYGSGPLLAKSVYAAGVGWMPLLVWRFVIAAAISWAWLMLRGGGPSAVLRDLRLMGRRRVLIFLGLGVFFTINAATYFWAIETVSASMASLIVYIYPAIVAVMTIRFGRTLEGKRPWIALGIVTLGVALTIGGVEAHAEPFGLILITASPVIYSIYIVLSARVAGERKGETADARGVDATPGFASSLMLVGSAITMIVVSIITAAPILPWQIPGGAWIGLIALAAVTAIAMQAFYAAAARIGAAQTSLVSTVEPVYTIVMATLLLGERLTLIQLAGGAFVIGGVILAQSSHLSRIAGGPRRVIRARRAAGESGIERNALPERADGLDEILGVAQQEVGR